MKIIESSDYKGFLIQLVEYQTAGGQRPGVGIHTWREWHITQQHARPDQFVTADNQRAARELIDAGKVSLP